METLKDNEDSKPINWVKGWIKELYQTLNTMNMASENSTILNKMEEVIKELLDISHREKMNDYIYIFSRRHKAINCLILLESIKQQISKEEFNNMKLLLKNIFLENWTKQILPKKHGILKASLHKTELYLNNHPYFEHKVLEPREYIGIDPEAGFDLDQPSIVTALTPAKYEQPIHNHSDNREVTFYTGPSIGKFYNEGEEISLSANFGDFIIFPPKTYHTINNPNEYPVRNISIKLPGALLDRSNTLDKTKGGNGEVIHIERLDQGVYKKSFKELLNLPYEIHIFDMNEIQKIKINPKGKSIIYTINGEFIVTFKGENGKKVLSESDIVVLNETKTVYIKRINDGGKLYMVTLI